MDQGERFIFKPLLYELLNGTAQSWEVAPTFGQLLAPYTIQFVQVSGCRVWGARGGWQGMWRPGRLAVQCMYWQG